MTAAGWRLDIERPALYQHQLSPLSVTVDGAQGWINPKLDDIGGGLEAPQYALTLNPRFDIGNCPFTGRKRPDDLEDYTMGSYTLA